MFVLVFVDIVGADSIELLAFNLLEYVRYFLQTARARSTKASQSIFSSLRVRRPS